MLSQLTKTIKMALKSTEEERAILRARSAVQRFPVVEWRQRTEDFHKRSITISRNLAGSNAWRESDCDGGVPRPMAETDDWNPVTQAQPTQPEWDSRSINENSPLPTPGYIPNSPGQWSQDGLSSNPQTPYANEEDYFAAQRGSVQSVTPGSNNGDGYNSFLERANKTIAKDQKHTPDPFLDPAGLAPTRPFGAHSRVSSVESISSIVEEKSNSPLNKAIASVSLIESAECTFLTLQISSLIPMVVLRPSSFKNCKCSTLRTRNMSYQLRSSWSRVKRLSSVK